MSTAFNISRASVIKTEYRLSHQKLINEPVSLPPENYFNHLTGTQMKAEKVRLFEAIYNHYQP